MFIYRYLGSKELFGLVEAGGCYPMVSQELPGARYLQDGGATSVVRLAESGP